MAVPPNINGETAKLAAAIYKKQKMRNTTLGGGVRWDQMKRIIVWKVDQLPPGETLEAQAKFDAPGVQNLGTEAPILTSATGSNNVTTTATPKFPVLVRGDLIDQQFSSVWMDQVNVPSSTGAQVQVEAQHFARVLHRKI
jgi:hypothetical protein